MQSPRQFILSRFTPLSLWSFLNDGAFGVGLAFFLSILFVYNWGESPLLWRVFSPKAISIGPGNHHALIMLLFGVVFYLTVYLKVNPLMAALGVYFYVESYEAQWYVTYVASKLVYGGQFQWGWMAISVMCIPSFIAYVYMFGVPWKYLASLTPIFIGWFLIGFPITNDFPGPSIWYTVLSVNALEIMTHVLAAVMFFYFIYPKLRKASDKVGMPWSNDFQPIVNFIRQRIKPHAWVKQDT